MLVRQITDPKLAQYAYLIGCQATREAIVVDPLRDVDTYLEAAQREGLRVVAVAETHIHADFLSGAREMAERVGATVFVSGEGGTDWQSEWLKGSSYAHRILRDGDHFMVGNVRFGVVHTPGHTPGHVVYFRERDGVAIAGDVLANMNFLTRRPGLLEPPRYFSVDWRLNRRSIRILRDLRPSLICFGHGPPLSDMSQLEHLVSRLGISAFDAAVQDG